MVGVEGVEEEGGVRAGVSLREELRVDLLEVLLVNDAARALVLEASVQDLQLFAGELGLLLELLQPLGAVADGGELKLILDAVFAERGDGFGPAAGQQFEESLLQRFFSLARRVAWKKEGVTEQKKS